MRMDWQAVMLMRGHAMVALTRFVDRIHMDRRYGEIAEPVAKLMLDLFCDRMPLCH